MRKPSELETARAALSHERTRQRRQRILAWEPFGAIPYRLLEIVDILRSRTVVRISALTIVVRFFKSSASTWTRRTLAIGTAAVLLGGLLAPLPPAAAETIVPTAADVRTDHPSLGLDQQKIAAIKSAIAQDPAAAAIYQRVKIHADKIFSESVLTKTSDGVRILAVSETLVDRAYTLGMTYLITGDRRYADRLWLDLDAASKFDDWNPNHFLDTAEMTQGMSVGYDWLYSYWTSSQRLTLTESIQRLGLEPALPVYSAPATSSGPYLYGGNWSKVENNWNVVVNGGMIAGALATARDNSPLADRILGFAVPSMKIGLAGFGPDGGYVEGTTYWAYATSYLALALSALDVATGSDWGLSAVPGVSEAGYFGRYMRGASQAMYNFGDSDTIVRNPPSQLFLAKKFDDVKFLEGGLNLTGSDAQRLLWYYPSMLNPGTQALARDRNFADAGVTTMRSSWAADGVSLGFRSSNAPAKGHQHQDAGSFILDALGERWSSDLGRDNYDLGGYLDPTSRWDYYRNRAEAHSTLLLDPFNPTAFRTSGAASVERSEANPASAFTISNLSGLYAPGTTWKRGVRLFDARGQVLVQDEVTRSGSFDAVWSMNTEANISLSQDGSSAILTSNGKQMLARIASAGAFNFTTMPAAPLAGSPNPPGQNSNAGNSKLSIVAKATDRLTLAVQFSPMREAVPAPPVVTSSGLGTWALDGVGSSRASAITIGSTPLVDFDPAQLSYTTSVDPSDAVPTVSAVGPGTADVRSTAPASLPGWATTTITGVGKTPTTYRVLLTKGSLTISSAVATSTASGSPALTFDGANSTYWLTLSDNSITWRLARASEIRRVELSWIANSKRLSEFELLSSPDGTTWTQRHAGAYTGAGGWDTVIASMPADTRFVRLLGHGDLSSGRWTALREVNFYSHVPAEVTVQPRQGLASVVVSAPVSMRIQTGAQASVTGTDTKGQAVPAEQLAPLWGSSNPSVLSIDGKGMMTARSVGKATIAALVTSGGETRSSSTPVSVVDPTKVRLYPTADSYVQGGSSASLNFGSTRGLMVNPGLASGTDLSYTRFGYMQFDLSQIKGRNVTGATLTSTSAITTGGTTAMLDFHDTAPSWTETGLTFSNRPALGAILGSTVVDATKGTRTTNLTAAVAAKASASVGVLSLGIDQHPGPLGIMVLVESRESATTPYLDITLDVPPTSQAATYPGSVSVSPTPSSLNLGQTQQLVPTVKDTTGAVIPPSNVAVSYTSSNAAVLSTNATGEIRAVTAGSATLTVKAAMNGITVSQNLPVTVVDARVVASIAANSSSSASGKLALTIAVTGAGEAASEGTVSISEGATTLKTGVAVTKGAASWSATGVSPGKHTYTVNYSGTDRLQATSTTVTATVKAKVSPTVSLSGTSSPKGKISLTITVKASGQTGLSGTATVKEGSKTLQSAIKVSGGKASWSATKVKAGNHTYTVSYSGTSEVNAGSAKVTVKIK